MCFSATRHQIVMKLHCILTVGNLIFVMQENCLVSFQSFRDKYLNLMRLRYVVMTRGGWRPQGQSEINQPLPVLSAALNSLEKST